MSAQWSSTAAPTQTNVEAYRIAGRKFEKVLSDLRALIENDLAGIEVSMEQAGAPWTLGRVPRWKME